MTDSSHEHTNALIREASPYLLQHAHNPVDWLPWGEAAFEEAAKQDKPVFLSVGYAACHWCHVMERESFENDSIAAYLNEHYIAIKVDREERPDIDHHYMQAVQGMTGRGGWPMSVFLTPDKKPFYGGTYWPPESRYGHPGFQDVLRVVRENWQNKRDSVLASADNIQSALESYTRIDSPEGELGRELFESFVAQSLAHYDSAHGGFGPAPKFPHAMELAMLLREWKRTGNDDARRMLEHTLTKMAQGGIYDQLGGGFARYSTDARWLVPHFEKMLYDNALLIPIYLDASLAFEREDFRQVAIESLEWVLREMEAPEGGFASSLDADSEGEEGKFYVWSEDEVAALLGNDAALFKELYDVTPGGNFEHGKSILNLQRRLSTDEIESLSEARRKLFDARESRVRPGRDDKVLTDWNGLFLSALVRGFAVIGDERYLRAAIRTAQRLATPFEADGELVHSFLGERTQKTQLLMDYAALGSGLLDLFKATGELRWFETAAVLADSLHERFYNPEGLYFLSADSVAGMRSIDPFDSAMPSGNSLAGNFMAELYYLTGDETFRARAESQITPLSGYFSSRVPNFAQAAMTADRLVFPPAQLILVEDPLRQMWNVAHSHYLPRVLTLWVTDSTVAKVGEEHPLYSLLGEKSSFDTRATLYFCRDFTCEMPETSVHKLQKDLAKLAEPGEK